MISNNIEVTTEIQSLDIKLTLSSSIPGDNIKASTTILDRLYYNLEVKTYNKFSVFIFISPRQKRFKCLPASAVNFHSRQYRIIKLHSTNIINLLNSKQENMVELGMDMLKKYIMNAENL